YGTDGGGADVGGADKGILGGLSVEDLGVADVEEGVEEANVEEEVILKRAIDKGKGIMLQEAKSRPKRKSRPRGNEIVIEDDANLTFTDHGDGDGSSENEIHFWSNNNNHTDDGCVTTCILTAIVNIRISLLITLVRGKKRSNRLYEVGDSETIIEHEEFMDDLLRKLRGDGCGIRDPFQIVETKVGEKFVDLEQQKKPEVLKDPSKGKPRSFNKYPSVDKYNDNTCPWRCYGKLMVTESSFQIISMNDKHTCTRSFKYGRLVNYKLIGKNFGLKIRINPDIKLHKIADMVMKKYKCVVSPHQCRNAKRWALNEGEATIGQRYALLRSYAKIILESNDGSIVKVGVTVNPNNKTYFDRFYVCFNGLKEGWKLGCRRVIALDGCFLKKPNVGEILTAIGRDGNNNIFPVAWALVNGLIGAVKDVMPNAEHRQCARHIYEGFRKQYSGVQFRGLFWAASKATYPEKFRKIMDKIKKANPNAHLYLMKKDPKTWSRAFFRVGSNCEAVENEFTSALILYLRVSNKPLITMLESMRVIVLERMNTMRQLMEAWTSEIYPNIQKNLELAKDEQRYHCTGGKLFELFGIPCPHVVAVIFKLNRMAEEYLPDCFRKDMYIQASNNNTS
ncbi:multidrug resistance-associated protein 5, partial [Tanacetum coccineum]